MTVPGVNPLADADLLRLALAVEELVPGDVEHALEHLRELGEALRVDEGSASRRGAPAASCDRGAESERLQGVVRQVEADLIGGHVRSLRGLARQVKRYTFFR
jgi:hypothetical protein